MSQGFGTKRANVAGSGPTQIFVNGVKQNSTSGTEIDFTIPSGVKRFVVTLDAVSLGAVDEVMFQLGDAGGIETTGYNGSTQYLAGTGQSVGSVQTDGFNMNPSMNADAALWRGFVEFVLHDAASNTWVVHGQYGQDGTGTAWIGALAGSKSLSGELTTVRVTRSGTTNTFDNGSINVCYDNPDPTVVADVQPGTVLGNAYSVKTDYQNIVSGTAVFDDSIPQSSELDEVMTCSYTPKKSNSILKVEFVCQASNDLASGCVVALFKDSETDARRVTFHYFSGAEFYTTIPLIYYMTAGTTDSITFKMLVGSNVGDVDINGDNTGGRRFGGVAATTITVTEIAA